MHFFFLNDTYQSLKINEQASLSEKCILWLKVCTKKAGCLQTLGAELFLLAKTPEPFAAWPEGCR